MENGTRIMSSVRSDLHSDHLPIQSQPPNGYFSWFLARCLTWRTSWVYCRQRTSRCWRRPTTWRWTWVSPRGPTAGSTSASSRWWTRPSRPAPSRTKEDTRSHSGGSHDLVTWLHQAPGSWGARGASASLENFQGVHFFFFFASQHSQSRNHFQGPRLHHMIILNWIEFVILHNGFHKNNMTYMTYYWL